MRTRVRFILVPLVVLALGVPAFAQQAPPQPPTPTQAAPGKVAPTPAGPGQTATPFSQQELDQMLAPIALYPDALLAQILMAATYPLEVVMAARWYKASPGYTGDAAVKAAESNNWDPSVKSLVAFPQILATMDEKLDWTERLGEAFLGQQAQVMDTVQRLRRKAQAAGNLKSNDQIDVATQGQAITVQPANPEVVYVPYYDPLAVFGTWWWPGYPPVYWGPWAEYGYDSEAGFPGLVWGAGTLVGGGFFYGGCDWNNGYVSVGNPNFYYQGPSSQYRPPPGAPNGWVHDPGHRREVPYSRVALGAQGGRSGARPPAQEGFGRPEARPPSEGANGGNRYPGWSEAGRPSGYAFQYSGRLGNRYPEGSDAGRFGGEPRPYGFERAGPGWEPRPHAYEFVGHGPDVRNYSARGHASRGGFAGPRSAGSRRR